MPAEPWCSVVIPSYNYAGFVGRAIDSALRSRGPSREVIVVDDGSTDDTAGVLESYSGRITSIRQSNQGVSAARNRGIAAARGRYVVCLDADDRLLEGGLEALAAAAERAPRAAMIFGAYQTVDACGRVQPSQLPPQMTTPIDNFRRYLMREFSIGNGRAAIRRDVFQRVQFPVGVTHGEDLVVFGQTLALYDAVSIPERIAESFEHSARARNNFSALLKNGPATIDALFRNDILPPKALALRPLFAARWYAELARGAFKMGDVRLARVYYHAAFGSHWTAWTRGRHVSRYLRTYLPSRAA